MGLKLLVVDDQIEIVEGLRYSLEQDGYGVDEAYDGKGAVEKALEFDYDLIILDLVLPSIEGLEVCRIIRETKDVPIIILTAKSGDIDKILGLEHGADDYVTKPFNVLELKARIKAILRRSQKKGLNHEEAVKHQISTGGLTINTIGRKVLVNGKEKSLTAKEFDLLLLLASNTSKVFTRKELFESIWGYNNYADMRTVDVHVRRLREKLEKDKGENDYIMTEWGVGYYFKGTL